MVMFIKFFKFVAVKVKQYRGVQPCRTLCCVTRCLVPTKKTSNIQGSVEKGLPVHKYKWGSFKQYTLQITLILKLFQVYKMSDMF